MGALLADWGAPPAVLGVLIAALILAPEGLAAVRAAKADRLQTSLNLALGSALATIGLTIPAVAILSIVADMPISLGLDAKSTVDRTSVVWERVCQYVSISVVDV